jgi:hypothetical protein
MKHLGLQEFLGTADINNAKVFSGNILNKLNVPLHRDVDGVTFGDLFSESNVLKFVDSNSSINILLDLNNDDIVKTLLLSEFVFDNFFNYGKTLQDSNSFNTKLDITSDFIQYKLDIDTDMTAYVDSSTNKNTIKIEIVENTQAVADTLIQYISNSFPLHTVFRNTVDNTSIENSVVFTSVDVDDTSILLTVLDTYIAFSNLENCNNIIIKTFEIVDVIKTENEITLPPHPHVLSNITDLEANTNNDNGYVRLTDRNLRISAGDR